MKGERGGKQLEFLAYDASGQPVRPGLREYPEYRQPRPVSQGAQHRYSHTGFHISRILELFELSSAQARVRITTRSQPSAAVGRERAVARRSLRGIFAERAH